MLTKIFSSILVKVSARYGAVSGIMCLIFIVTFYYMGKSPLLINPYVDFRVLLFGILIFFCLREVRDFYQGGALKMWEGMAGGLVFLVVTSGIAAIGIYIFGVVESGFVPNYVDEMTRQIQGYPDDVVKKIGKDVLERNLKELPATNLHQLAGLYVWQTYLIGFFVTVIISVILRRQPKTQ